MAKVEKSTFFFISYQQHVFEIFVEITVMPEPGRPGGPPQYLVDQFQLGKADYPHLYYNWHPQYFSPSGITRKCVYIRILHVVNSLEQFTFTMGVYYQMNIKRLLKE